MTKSPKVNKESRKREEERIGHLKKTERIRREEEGRTKY
jgi:hypothetical protein